MMIPSMTMPFFLTFLQSSNTSFTYFLAWFLLFQSCSPMSWFVPHFCPYCLHPLIVHPHHHCLGFCLSPFKTFHKPHPSLRRTKSKWFRYMLPKLFQSRDQFMWTLSWGGKRKCEEMAVYRPYVECTVFIPWDIFLCQQLTAQLCVYSL